MSTVTVESLAPLAPADSAARVHLEKVAESARRGADLNAQLLAFAGKGKLLSERVDLHGVIARTVEAIRNAQPTPYRIELDLDGGARDVMGDANQLARAVRNLVLNAVEARRSPGDLLTIRTRVLGDPFAVRIEFADTGAGMEPDVLARIFDPFFTTKSLGRGLGLPAVHGIVTAHGGTITAASEPGRGTTVAVILPAAPERETVTAGASTPVAPASERRSVLIIDDEETVRTLVVQMLQKLGWEALSADGGRKGIEGFQGNVDRVALVVLDLMMPEMNGIAVQAALRAVRPDLPILFCTGYSAEAMDAETHTGPSGLLLKPFSLADLEAAIANLLRKPVPSGPRY